MPPILTDARLLIGLILIILLVVGVNFVLFNLLRGHRPSEHEVSILGRALGGAQRAQRQQAADYDKLHQAVTALKSSPSDVERPIE